MYSCDLKSLFKHRAILSTSAKYGVLLALLVLAKGAFAQSEYQVGTLPSINFNKKWKKDWSLNAKVETRQIYQTGDFTESAKREFEYELTDLTMVGSKKVGFYGRIGVGYLFRMREGAIIHRISQQYNFTKQYQSVRLSHRVLTDQTFFDNESPDFRLRYRISAQVPLNGKTLDVHEWYFKGNHEYVNNVQASTYNLEIRWIPMMGYVVNPENKVEIGIDYRFNSIVSEDRNHRFWLALNWFWEL